MSGDLENNIAQMSEKIKKFKEKNTDIKPEKSKSVWTTYNKFITCCTEFIAGIFIGVAIGLFLDKIFNTKIIFLIIFSFLGFMASILNVYKILK